MQRVRAAPVRAGDTKIVAIDGPSGSGKTTLAGRLPGPVMHMEDIYPGWDGLRDSIRRLVEWVLEPLATGGRAGWRRYDWEHGRYAEWHDLPAPRTLMIEGVGAGALAAAPYVSVLIWVDAPLSLPRGRKSVSDASPCRKTGGIVRDAERVLWVLMAELATAPANRHKLTPGTSLVTHEMVERIESVVDGLGARFELPAEFVIPGQERVPALLDVARTVTRRAERLALAAVAPGSEVVPYLNRLSTLLWVAARWPSPRVWRASSSCWGTIPGS